MTHITSAKQILPHGPLETLSENLWRVQGQVPRMTLQRVMTVIKKSDGGVMLHSPIWLDEALLKLIEQWGSIEWILIPGETHRLDASAYAERYPNAKVICPKGATEKVRQKSRVDGTYETFEADSNVELRSLRGTHDLEGVVIVRCNDGVTLIFNDLIFNMPHVGGVIGFLLKYITQSTGGPRMSRVARALLVKDKIVLKNELFQLSNITNLNRIVVSHHQVIVDKPAHILRDIATSLTS